MLKPLHLFPNDTAYDFVGQRARAFALSLFLVLGSIGAFLTVGLNYGIDFVGGSLILVRADSGEADIGAMRAALDDLELGEITLQRFGDNADVAIRVQAQAEVEGEDDAQAAATRAVQEALGPGFQQLLVEFVGPTVGAELIEAGIYAVIAALLGIMAYIWLRFEWHFGVAAIAALTHDVVTTIGLFAIAQIEFNLSTVAALLMISGYSINDTVVVFDRLREDLRRYKSWDLERICNYALNRTLSRTLMTSITTLLALLALWIFGGEVIRGFVTAMLWGVAIGTYSSIFIATPVLMAFRLKPSDLASGLGDDDAQGADGKPTAGEAPAD